LSAARNVVHDDHNQLKERMVWRWWVRRRRAKWASQPFPSAWQPWLAAAVRGWDELPAATQQQLQNLARCFLLEKHWEGCQGLTVTDEMRVTIAAQAARLSLGFDEPPFDRLLSVLIYPDTFVSPQPRLSPAGVVDLSSEPRLGEAWYRGPVLLSWREVRLQCLEQHAGRNVVVHELAHILDMSNGAIDGVPGIDDAHLAARWQQVMADELKRLRRHLATGRETVIDAYGAINEAEFFAVTSEAFFEMPHQLSTRHPVLFDLFAQFYRQNPGQLAAAQGDTAPDHAAALKDAPDAASPPDANQRAK
jgi:MtfA peptidase